MKGLHDGFIWIVSAALEQNYEKLLKKVQVVDSYLASQLTETWGNKLFLKAVRAEKWTFVFGLISVDIESFNGIRSTVHSLNLEFLI